jgi:hypothetical protein
MIEFEERAVAFIDILGFKNLVNSSIKDHNASSKLSNLIDLLKSAVPLLDERVDNSLPAHLIPKHIYISDCIILSTPLTDSDRTSYSGLDVIIMRVIQLTHFFLEEGYLIKGGISIGKVWHADFNIVGPAYQEAYLLESKEKDPFVFLSKKAIALNRQDSRMCITHNDKIIVNGLLDDYILNNTQHGIIEKTYERYQSLVKENIEKDLPWSAKMKWYCFNEYLCSEIKYHEPPNSWENKIILLQSIIVITLKYLGHIFNKKVKGVL